MKRTFCAKGVAFLAFVLFVASCVLIVASGATSHWLLARPTRGDAKDLNGGVEKDLEGLSGRSSPHFVRSGLFHGVRRLDWGVGMRTEEFTGTLGDDDDEDDLIGGEREV